MKINEEILNETLAHLILVERGALSVLIQSLIHLTVVSTEAAV